ncbi:VIT family protein [bacterium BMS3Bbin12]|nr:VIT family protein [bacterium BMS3Abin12]GBE47726.1 VIT family protein [bacterium BMS3Bbin12]GBE49922.1 VIT family protein [bacterium BMS3Bbin13]
MSIHPEKHFSGRIGWLRAAVLGANDGIISTASLIMGVAAADVTPGYVLTAGVAGLVAGAMSMAAGEYVSVSSQADTEKADLDRERRELAANPESEHRELARIYVKRGLEPALADEVAKQLMEHDSLAAHARDELGLSEIHSARPVQAALTSAAAFSIGASMPILATLFSPPAFMMPAVAASSLVFLVILGGLAGYAGGAKIATSASRVVFWGALAMAITTGVGRIIGAGL